MRGSLNKLFGLVNGLRVSLKVKTALAVVLLGVSVLVPRMALATSFQLSGTVNDSVSVAVSGASIAAIDESSNATVATTTSDGSGHYALQIAPGMYKIQVTPPSGSPYAPIIALDRTVSADTTLDFVFAPQGLLTLSGHVVDSLGHTLSNQTVFLQQNGQPRVQTTTDVNGNYSLQAAPGIYLFFEVAGGNNGDTTLAVPDSYDMYLPNYSFNQSTIVDITVPATTLAVHVQTPAGAASSGSQVNVGVPQNNFANGGGLSFSPSLGGGYGHDSASRATNASGDVSMWVFANDNFAGHFYSITVTPPNGSGFLQTTLPNVFITGPTQKTITLNAQLATVNGHVYDHNGTPLQGVTVFLGNSDQGGVLTDANGYYEMHLLPNSYIFFGLHSNGGLPELPGGFQIYIPNYTLTGDTTVDFTIPVSKVTVHIQDAFGNPLSGVSVGATSTNGGGPYGGFVNQGGVNLGGIGGGYARAASSGTSDASGMVTMWLIANDGFPPNFYKFTATPQSGTPYLTTSLNSVQITSDTNLTITMNSQLATLSGHVHNKFGVPLANQTVQLRAQNNGVVASSITDQNGFYTMQALPDTYLMLEVESSSNDPSLDVPSAFDIYVPNYQLAGATSLDLTIPAQQVTVHVQDVANLALEGIAIGATSSNGGGPFGGFVNTSGSVNLGGIGGGYARAASGGITDTSGNLAMWLIANDNFAPDFYNFSATPPSGGSYTPFTVSQVQITTDQTEIISLQFVHARPVTTATLSPSPNGQGAYPNPVTVSLSATAAQGFSIAATHYSVDGGADQLYSGPFSVSGPGNHSVSYWSVDNVGVYESPQSTPFTISSRQLTALAPAQAWIGLKNSDDVGVKFDLLAQAYAGSTLVASGELDSFAGGSSGFNNAHLASIPFSSFSPVDFPTGTPLKIALSVRNACSGSGHNSGAARLWFNDSAAASQFGATIDSPQAYFLLDNFLLGTSAGPGPKLTVDVQSGAKCSAFKPFGTWTTTP